MNLKDLLKAMQYPQRTRVQMDPMTGKIVIVECDSVSPLALMIVLSEYNNLGHDKFVERYGDKPASINVLVN